MNAIMMGSKRLLDNQVFRFLLLGGFAAAVNWVVRFPLSLFLPFEWAVFFAYLIGMSVGFVLYRSYVFPGSTRSTREQVFYFLVVNAAGAVIVTGLAALLVAGLEPFSWPLFIKEGLGHGIAIGAGAVFNFFGHRIVTFARPASGGDR